MTISNRFITFFLSVLLLGGSQMAVSADHGDTPLLRSIGRNDARITDLHAFVRGSDLVVALSTNPGIPAGVTDYVFPSDVEFKIIIDNKRKVSFEDADEVSQFGGTVVKPSKIKDKIEFEFSFDQNGELEVEIEGIDGAEQLVSVFSGLRDDPFIRAPRTGRNIASIVVQIPLSAVIKKNSTILIWATTEVDDLGGPQHEAAGAALSSQFPEGDALNSAKPSLHVDVLGYERPDVLIFDTSRPASYPNGRDLADDVVNLVCDLINECRAQDSDFPFPTENDVPFLLDFPYLAAPHVSLVTEL